MNKCRRFAVSAAVVLFSIGAGTPPKAIEEKDVVAGKAKLDPSRGYIFLQAPVRTFGIFLRLPDAEVEAEYAQDRDEAFAKAQKRYPGQLEVWEKQAERARSMADKVPPRPLEPNRETFPFEPVELRDVVMFGPSYVYNKAENRFSYLTSVKPGTYIWYGNIMMAAEIGWTGICMCMGSVKFEVRPGAVTDLGNFLSAGPQRHRLSDVGTLEATRIMEAKATRTGKPADPSFLMQEPVAFGVPDSLKAWGPVQAEFSANGKMNNYYGVTVSRLPAAPGILAYRRDTIIDARTGNDLPNPVLTSRAKLKN